MQTSYRYCTRLWVTGNHDLWRSDYDEFERELTEVGVKTLHDERVIFCAATKVKFHFRELTIRLL